MAAIPVFVNGDAAGTGNQRAFVQQKRQTSRAGPEPIKVSVKVGLGFHLREAYRAFSRQFHGRLARHDITHAQWVVLWLISQAGSLTPILLAREAGIKKASATSVIESLKRRKLIHGVRDEHDRRKLNLSLTPAGATLVKTLIACAAETNALGRGGLSEDEVATLLRLLRTVTANFEGRET
jgi:MarR family transcriptional regulator, organic hydroperoxide resistance regulator